MSEAYLDKLRGFYEEERRLPSYGELARELGFKSKNAAVYVVQKWLEQGVVKKDSAGKLVPGAGFGGLRLLGTVAAGFPSAVEEDVGETVSLDDWLVKRREATYMLTVSGDSMIDAGIQPGDRVLLERGRSPKHGDIVVAEVDHEWTLKTFEKSAGRISLVPANKKYKVITAEEEILIAGVVTAVIRKY